MINVIRILAHYIKKIISSGFTYFVIFVLFLVFSAKKFKENSYNKPEKPGIHQQIIEYAYSLRGVDYKSGGISLEGFDCSGFTRYVYGHFGYQIPRSSRSQYQRGKLISNDSINIADLVFFKGRNVNSERVGHVGIVVSKIKDNNFAFIHASFYDGIKVDSISNQYYNQRYLGAKRYISFQQD